MKLVALGFSNFRSIGDEPVFVDLGKKVSVLIGANNSGKSNLIKALVWLSGHRRLGRVELDQLDQHRLGLGNLLRVHLRARLDDEPALREAFPDAVQFTVQRSVEGVFECVETPFEALSSAAFRRLYEACLRKQLKRHLARDERVAFRRELGLALAQQLLVEKMPHVEVVPQFRQITPGPEYGVSGRGIVEALASWQSPGIRKGGLSGRFRRVRELLQELLHESGMRLEVTQDEELALEAGGLRLPLESYGTGVHELIILAVAVQSLHGALICIEEPEIHLHPSLQQELLRYLVEEPGNTYVLSTHSNALMQPSDDVGIVHLWAEGGVTRGRAVETSADALEVLSDLGVRASDLLQANSVVWVEGPSDRVYLNRWLELVAPDLRDGVHYSTMFYGGSLLSHLSLERDPRPGVEDLISLLKVNQHSAIVIDRGRGGEAGGLGATKRRIQDECGKSSVVCWVTSGREIENYLPSRAVATAYRGFTGTEPRGLAITRCSRLEGALESAFAEAWKPGWSYERAKPVWARRIAPHITEADITPELRTELEQLVAMIRAAN